MDGTDVVKRLRLLMRGGWDGDIDLNVGLLQCFRLKFEERMKCLKDWV